MEALVRSVGRAHGKRGLLARILGIPARPPRRDDFAIDLRDRGEDVWRALRY